MHRLIFLSFAALWMIGLALPGAAAEPNGKVSDRFVLDGASNIIEENDFGIVNGKLTCGVRYRDVFSISGLWAPPYVSSDFNLSITVLGRPIATNGYTWRPFQVDRAGLDKEIAIESVTMLVPGSRAGLVEVTLKNQGTDGCTVPVAIAVGGTLDRAESWEFGAPHSHSATVRRVRKRFLKLEQGKLAIVLRGSDAIQWKDSQPCGYASLSLLPSRRAKLYVVFAIGPAAEATAECEAIAADPAKAILGVQAAYAERIKDVFDKLPQFESNNPLLDKFYYRSLVHFVMNRWDVPEFILHPYYGSGSVKGGCVCDYLWSTGQNWEIFPLYDAETSRSHIKQFLATDMTQHFAFDPIKGTGFGPLYPVNQEKIVGLIYYHVKNTGDAAFLNDRVNDKTVLEHAIANAMYGDDPAKPVALIDYGPANNHLELRLGLPYNHVMPDLNGRRYQNYVLAAELADLAGKPAPQLRQRAEELKTALKCELWNKKTRWFDFRDDKGKIDARYTLQMFKLFGSKVLDAEEEAGLLDHLKSEREFLSDFGLHSLSKTDPAYDQADIDNGGPGACTSFPPQIAERLYKMGRPDAAENILKRILWWGERMPYWGDSIVADKIDYRKDTPLQCHIDGAAAAQCIIFGMFGVEARFNGDIRISPHPPEFAPQVELKGLRLRGRVLDIAVNGAEYDVYEGNKRIHTTIGRAILVQGDKLVHDDAHGQ
jgi:hypothetical protein